MTVSLIFILGISLFASSARASNCGPNACADLWVANDCDTVQYCIENEWSKLKPTGKTDDICNICLRMVQEARTTLESNDTQEALKQVLEGSCKLLLLKPAVELCDKLADELVPQLVAILASQMDPETVCSVAKLCNNAHLRDLQEKSKECTECREFMAGAKDSFSSFSEKEFQEGFLSLCRDTGSYSDACYSISAPHSDFLYNHTKMALNGVPCEATLLCPSSTKSEPNQFSPETISKLRKRMCPLCPRVTQNIIRQLTRTKSPEDYRQNLVKICTRLNFPVDFCEELAKSSRMSDFLKQNEENVSRVFCRKTICRERRSEQTSLWPLLPVHHSDVSIGDVEDMILRSLVDFIREDGEKHLPLDMDLEESEEDPKDDTPLPVPDCEACKSVMKTLQEDENISGASDSLCDRLARESQKACRFIVQTHGAKVRKAISHKWTPQAACLKMNYCSPEKADKPITTISYGDIIENPFFLTPVLVDESTKSISYGDNIENPFFPTVGFIGSFYQSDCEMCRQLSRVLSNYVNVSNSYMKQALGVSCLMSRNLGKCSTFLESYSPDIARAFAEYVSSDKVCQDVKPSCEPQQPFVAPKASLHLCRKCKTWVEGVTSLLLDDKNMEMFKATFASACDEHPKALREKCRHATALNSEQKLAAILKRLSPNEACGSLNYCPRLGGETSSADTSVAETSPLEKVPCKFCLLAMKTLLDQLQDNKTEAAIRSALESLCKYVPEEMGDTCRNLVDQYADVIIDMIIADFNPSEICIRLKMCKPNNTLTHESSPLRVFDINTNEIRDVEELSLKNISEDESAEVQADQALLDQVHSAVQECALCEALVQVISSHPKMLVKDYDFYGNASTICKIVPRRKRKQCMSMIVSYGPSIVNLIVDKKVNPNDVCVELTLCDASMHARVDMPVSVPEPNPSDSANGECLKGPSFWCASEENAKKCGTFLHCRELVWKTEKPLKNVSAETP